MDPLPSFAVSVKRSGCPKRHSHATVNARNFQEEQHRQGRWTKRFSRRQREGAYTTSGGAPEETTLYPLVQEHLETSKARV